MLFSRFVSVSSLVELCRMLRHSLGAGINIMDVFQQQSQRSPAELQALAGRVAAQLKKGRSLISALRKETVFPPLFLSMVEVGEETGHLAEVFESLEQYYTLQQQIQRRFRAGIFLPALQFCIAVLVVALVIWLLGMIGSARGGTSSGILGLSGTSGAVTFLVVVGGTVAALLFGGLFFYQKLRGKYMLDALVLRLPVIGACTQALAMARFTMAMNLTLETGMLISRAMRLSLQATGNAAFEAEGPAIEKELKHGSDLTLAITGAWVFPGEFRHILGVGEQSGRVPEVMRQQCRYFQEEGERKVKALLQLATWFVWLLYAVFVIIMIFQLAGFYFGALPQ